MAFGHVIYDLAMEDWKEFKAKYEKNYENESMEDKRFRIFLKNLLKIKNHNLHYESGQVTWKMEMNSFGDMEQDEITAALSGINITSVKSSWGKNKAPIFLTPENTFVPEFLNWTEKGAVTNVKNQEFCGSCWAFATTGALEGQTFRLTKKLVSLSEQNLMDCSWDYGNNGCSGGWMTYSYEYVRDNNGIDTEQGYPYLGEDWPCNYDSKFNATTDAGYMELPSGNEEKLMEAVATVGPISVAIDASDYGFSFYKSGVYVGYPCEKDYVDHAVLVVGYGTDKKTAYDYWLVKNSWGLEWGENGYVKLLRSKKNYNCIASYASYPLL